MKERQYSIIAFPKPKNQKQPPTPYMTKYDDGRIEYNLHTEKGRVAYVTNMHTMWERQGHICCLKGHIVSCPGILHWSDCTFDHEVPRGHGGGSRDDRIEIQVKQKDGTYKTVRQNGAAHFRCNSLKGSRRIPYNAAHNGEPVWELIPKFTNSGKVLFRCSSCGYETPAPTKNHACASAAGKSIPLSTKKALPPENSARKGKGVCLS